MVVSRAIGRSTRPSGPRKLRRPGTAPVLLLGLLLAVSLVSTSFDLHPHAAQDADHAIVAGGDHGALAVFSGASHPHQAPHVEASGRMVTFRCPACLLHLQSQGDADRHVPFASVPSATEHVRAPAAPHRRGPARLPGGSRAPPFA